ncbi:MAG: hypothetical protein HWN68_05945 [Desulfobacterales bacterium]|nr:hypothetical protein [Desulfobacterales bacterium]
MGGAGTGSKAGTPAAVTTIISLQEALDFLGIGKGYFEITAENDVLNMSYDGGAYKDVDCDDGTYDGDDLAAELKSKIDTIFSITSTVAYNSSTYKFTITVAASHTITIKVSASDAALTFGFTSDPTAAQSITSDEIVAEDPTAMVQTVLDGVDKWIKEYCQRDFVQTSYREYSNGDGGSHLFLKQYPIISVSRLSIGRNNAIKVNNSLTATYATVSVTSTGVVLNKDGTETPLLFATYATIALMAAAIANETNWQASVMNSSYASYASTELIEAMGLECLNASWAYLEIPDEPDSAFEVLPDSGIIHRTGGFPRGHRNIRTDYKAGFATLPEDLKLGVSILVKLIYQKRGEESFGLTQGSLSYVRKVFEKEMPSEVKEILSRYRKIEV